MEINGRKIMGLKDKLKEFIAPEIDDDGDILELDEEEAEAISKYEAPRSKNVTTGNIDTKMVLFEPRTYDEASQVALNLKSNKACVVNLHRLQRDAAQRTIDFLTGVMFALDGTIQKIGPNIILCAPKTMGVGGKINVDGDDDE